MELESEEENSEDEYVPGNLCLLRRAFHDIVQYNYRNWFFFLDKEAESSEETESDEPSSEEGESSANSESESPTPKKVM